MSKKYYHFTIGPVQSFVGQARRTRDFWAGSFLLSWLSGIAMISVRKQGGIIIFPSADEKFLNAIKGNTIDNNLPKQGSIPNRFKAEINTEFDPEQVVTNVKKAWKELADKIYGADIKKYQLNNTRSIWDRQVKNFWDISWVIVSEKKDSSALDRRKNFRSHYIPDEAGIKCSLMADWQELSGIEGVSKKDREERDKFWQAIREHKKRNEADFKEKEYLCAMAFIKRRFTTVFSGEIAKFNGWKLPRAVPSVSYIAAAPWYKTVLDDTTLTTKVVDFYKLAEKLCLKGSEYHSGLKCMDETERPKVTHKVKALDGNVFHEAMLDNPNIFEKQDQTQKVKKALKELTDSKGKVSPFYALLMMDGDSLGTQMSDTDKQPEITQRLQRFIADVPKIVYDHNGFLIYAGGDDVLALVTLEDALACAYAIHKHYDDCFENTKMEIETSISAAIIYAHIRIPLSNLLHDIHELLDDVAKTKTDRNALAVRVYKPGGVTLEWSRKWEYAVSGDVLQIEKTVKEFVDKTSDLEQFSNKFFYKLGQRFKLFETGDKPIGVEVKGNTPAFGFEESLQIMAMEYCQSVDNKDVDIEQAKSIVRPLLQQCQDQITGKITIDAALLVRFLAQKGLEGNNA